MLKKGWKKSIRLVNNLSRKKDEWMTYIEKKTSE